jgi:hypothetical protein
MFGQEKLEGSGRRHHNSAIISNGVATHYQNK